MNLLELFVGQILDAVYFSLFLIYTKSLQKDKRKCSVLMILMIVEYVILINCIPYTIWVYILYFVVVYILLKILYNKKSQIIDVFTLGLSHLSVIIINGLSFLLIMPLTNNYLLFVLIARLLLFSFLLITKDKLYKIQKLYIHLWNRDDKVKKKIKSTTFRCMNVVLFNSIFLLINIGIIIYNIIRG